MDNLILLLKKYHIFLLFLLLEIICFFFFINRNDYAKASFMSSSNGIIGNLYQKQTDLNEYLALKEINAELARENVQMREQLEKVSLPLDSALITHPYTSAYDTSFRFIGARIISTSLYNQNNLITLNKGKLDSIGVDMGVINADGVVGIVINVSDHFSIVRPIINKAGFISGMLKSSHEIGTVKWLNLNYKEATLSDISNERAVYAGDTVVTSGLSGNFPAGILIGIVKQSLVENGHEFYDVPINLSVNFKRASYVLVIKNVLNSEKQNLEAIKE